MILWAFFALLTILALEDWWRLSVSLPLVILAWALTSVQFFVDGALLGSWIVPGYWMALGGFIASVFLVMGAGAWIQKNGKRQWMGSGDLWILPPTLAFLPLSQWPLFLIMSGCAGVALAFLYRPPQGQAAPTGAFPLIPAFWLGWIICRVL